MGLHAVYDNMSVKEARWFIGEIQDHIYMLLLNYRSINDRNKSRFERKVNGDDNVSDYESIEEWEELSDYFDYELEEEIRQEEADESNEANDEANEETSDESGEANK